MWGRHISTKNGIDSPIRNSFHRLVWFLVLLAMPGARSVEADCVLVSNGLDPLSWNGSASTLLGEAIGQTFLARDTLMTMLTVWRPPNTRSVIGAHRYITAVDTTWTPARPDVHRFCSTVQQFGSMTVILPDS